MHGATSRQLRIIIVIITIIIIITITIIIIIISFKVQRLDNYGGISESVDRQSCYLMRVDEMYAEVGKDQIVNI